MKKSHQDTEQNTQLELEELAKTLRRPRYKIYLLASGLAIGIVLLISGWMYAMSVALTNG